MGETHHLAEHVGWFRCAQPTLRLLRCEPCQTLDHELAALARRHPDAIAVRKLDVVDTDSPASKQYVGAATLPHVKVYGRDGKLLFARSAPPLQLVADIEAALDPPKPAAKPAAKPAPTSRRIAITVTDRGFEPARVTVGRNEAVTLVFRRTSTKTCATDVHMTLPGGGRVDQQLPLDQAVAVPLRVAQPGELTYACGMDMVRGTIVVR